MNEKEKKQHQLLYDANDEELIAERIQAKELCYDFNHTRPSDEEKQRTIMNQLLGKINGSFKIEAPFWCDYGYNIEIGDNFFANHDTVILDCAKVVFGNHVVIGGGSVVVKDIPDYSVALGNPCKVIRQITDEDRNEDWNRYFSIQEKE